MRVWESSGNWGGYDTIRVTLSLEIMLVDLACSLYRAIFLDNYADAQSNENTQDESLTMEVTDPVVGFLKGVFPTLPATSLSALQQTSRLHPPRPSRR